jgi:hypothetical protein
MVPECYPDYTDSHLAVSDNSLTLTGSAKAHMVWTLSLHKSRGLY